jgi:MoaA/NifB/PqqE/SkfB family radical SAM enzyme
MSLPENFCVSPFIQLTTHPSGSYGPCPYLGGTQWKSDPSQVTITNQWNSSALTDLRKQFINNEKPAICQRCWHEEDNGKRSLRRRFWEDSTQTTDFFNLITPNLVAKIKNNIKENILDLPIILTIKNGNVCNAKCRVCHPGDSSRWSEDTEKLFDITGKKYYNITTNETNWTDQQLEEILTLSTNLQRLELFGGEPTYNKKVIKLLNQLVEQGLSKNIVLYINTNGSVNIVEKIPNIKEFARVEIGVSLDGVKEQFNYIRHGLEYNQVIANIKLWQVYFKQHQVDYWIDSISTVDILNIYYLPELKQAVKEVLPLSPFWNLLVQPEYLFIKNMPDHVKSAVIEKLSGDVEFADLINVIRQPADLKEWNKFLEVTSALDKIRDENFKETFSEFNSIIESA